MSERHPARQQLILVCPILPGRVEAWRRFIQEMMEENGEVYAESRTHFNICEERIWIHETVDAANAIVVIETDQPKQILHQMTTSEWPYNSRLRQLLLDHLGAGIGVPIHKHLPELVFEWQAA